MRRGFYIGFIAGGILGLAIALGMDFVLGDALGGTWRDAVAHDLGALLGRTVDRNSLAVIAGVVLVVGIIGIFGALSGGIFGVIMARLLSFLTRSR